MSDDNKRLQRERGVEVHPNVVVDPNAELIMELTDAQFEFFKKIEGQSNQNAFLQMSNDDKQELMVGNLSDEEKCQYYEHASKLAVRYTNAGYIIFKKMREFRYKKAFVGVCATAFLSMLVDTYFMTVGVNKQLQLETIGASLETIPAAFNTINANKQGINDSTALMSTEQYANYITQPNMQCGVLNDLSDSFYAKDGKPLCKKDGDVLWIAGYVKNPTFPEPVLNIIRKGVLYNVDLSPQNYHTVALAGGKTVRFEMIQEPFKRAFPDFVRSSETDVITKAKNK